MSGRSIYIAWRRENTLDALHAAYRGEDDTNFKPWLHALWREG